MCDASSGPVRLEAAGWQRGASPPGLFSAAEWPGWKARLAWATGAAAGWIGAYAASPYGGFAGPLPLVDGDVFGPGTRIWEAGLQPEAGSARVLLGWGLPLWYVHGRWVEGRVWAGEWATSRFGVQGVVSDTGLHRLTFATLPDTTVRRLGGAAGGWARWRGDGGIEVRGAAGLSEVAWRDGALVEGRQGWAVHVAALSRRPPRGRMTLSAASPAFEPPLLADRQPPPGQIRASGRLGPGPEAVSPGAWVQLEGRWPWPQEEGESLYRAGAGRRWQVDPGRLALHVEWEQGATQDDEQHDRSGRAAGVGGKLQWDGHRGGGSVRWDPLGGGGPDWSGWLTPGAGWRLRATWLSAGGVVRLEASWGPGGFDPGWPARGARLVYKVPGSRSAAPYLYFEAGWSLGRDHALGIRVGRWDQGIAGRFPEGAPPILVMVRGQV
ncbi:hypothetical protein U7230_04910 [Carboxydochorda subterranea]|uniref:Uncharacterized protein n=1 Tax=Carboxydichorda subterranea TaxID=3109565 RepID=A0ABZ1C0S8_9FIRM|nr:hypothetical protein [Limnochorda sp. L945t]WRP18351.1 hypothetical protein U7230_04910 [Limnochorda sp. L945t]